MHTMDRYQFVGWYLECRQKKIGQEIGQVVCPESTQHEFNVYNDTNYCPVCGSKLIEKMIDRYASFMDLFEDESGRGDYIPIEIADQLELMCRFIPIESRASDVEILKVTFINSVLDVLEEEKEGMYEIDIDEHFVEKLKKERERIEEAIKLLSHIYDDVKIHYGTVIFYR